MSRLISIILSGLMSMMAVSGAGTTAEITGDQTSGGDVDVVIRFVSDQEVGSLGGKLYYDDSLLEFVSGDASGGGGILTFQGFPMDNSGVIELDLSFKPISDGMSGIYIDSCYVFSPDGMVLAEPTAETSVTFTASGNGTTAAAPAETSAPDTETEKDTETVTEPPETTTTAETSAPESDTASEEPAAVTVTEEKTDTPDEESEEVEPAEEAGSDPDSSKPSVKTASSQDDSMEKYKRVLNPALAVVLVVLVVSLVIFIIHLTGRNSKKKKRRR